MISSRPRAGEPIKFVSKGWGYEKWIVNSEQYCGKLLFIAKENNVLNTFIKKKDEVFYVQVEIKIYYGWDDNIEMGSVAVLEPGDKFHVPIGMKHRMYGLLDTELFEFSTEHFDEDSNRIQPGD